MGATDSETVTMFSVRYIKSIFLRVGYSKTDITKKYTDKTQICFTDKTVLNKTKVMTL